MIKAGYFLFLSFLMGAFSPVFGDTVGNTCVTFYHLEPSGREEIKVKMMAKKLREAMARTKKNLPEAIALLVGTDPDFRSARAEISGFDKKVKAVLLKPVEIVQTKPEPVAFVEPQTKAENAEQTQTPITEGRTEPQAAPPAPTQVSPPKTPPTVRIATVLKNRYYTFDVRKITYFDWLGKKIDNVNIEVFDSIFLSSENLEYFQYFSSKEKSELYQEIQSWKVSTEAKNNKNFEKIQQYLLSTLKNASSTKLDNLEAVGLLNVKSTVNTKMQAGIIWKLFENPQAVAWLKSKGYYKYLLNLTKQTDISKLNDLFESNVYEQLYTNGLISSAEYQETLLPLIKNKKFNSDYRVRAAFKLMMIPVTKLDADFQPDLTFLKDLSEQQKGQLAASIKGHETIGSGFVRPSLELFERFHKNIWRVKEVAGEREHNLALLTTMHDMGVITFDPSELFALTRGKNVFFQGVFGEPSAKLTEWINQKGYIQKFENMRSSIYIDERNAYMTLKSHELLNIQGYFKDYKQIMKDFKNELVQTIEDKSLSSEIRMHAFMMGTLFKFATEYTKYLNVSRSDMMFADYSKLSEHTRKRLDEYKEITDRMGGEMELSLEHFSLEERKQLTSKFYSWVYYPRVVNHAAQSNDILVSQISGFVASLPKLWFESLYALDKDTFRTLVDLQLVTLNTKNSQDLSVFELALNGNQPEMMDIILSHPKAIEAIKNEPAYYHQLTGNHYPPSYTGQVQPRDFITTAHQMGRHEIAMMMEKIKEIKPMKVRQIGRKWNGRAPVTFVQIPKSSMGTTHYYESNHHRRRIEVSPNFEVMSTKVTRQMWREIGNLGHKRVGRQDFLLEMEKREKNWLKRNLLNAKSMSRLWDLDPMRDDEITREDMFLWISLVNGLSRPFYGGEPAKESTKKLEKLFPGHKPGMYYRLLEPGEFEQLIKVLPVQKNMPGSKESKSYDMFDDKNVVYINGQPIFQLNEKGGEMTLNLRGRQPGTQYMIKPGQRYAEHVLVVPPDYFAKTYTEPFDQPKVMELGGFRLVREMTKPSDQHP